MMSEAVARTGELKCKHKMSEQRYSVHGRENLSLVDINYSNLAFWNHG